MSISSRSNVKSGLMYIKDNFGGLWIMLLKIFLSAIPFILIVGVSVVGLMGFGSMMDMMSQGGVGAAMGTDMIPSVMGAVPDASHMGSMMTGPSAMNPAMLEKLQSISMGEITVAGFGSLLGFLLVMLAGTAMMVAIIRSIVLDQPLETSIFSKLFDKTVLKVFGTVVLIYFVIGLVTAAIVALGFATHPSAFILMFISLYLMLRLALIPVGVAVDDINSLSDACCKTKGQVWNVFKVILLSILIIAVFQIILSILGTGLGAIGGAVGGVLMLILMVTGLVIMMPLQQLLITSMAYLYKAIR